MESLLHDLGIDPKAVIIQAVGFLVMFLILKKFAFGKIGGLLEARRRDVETRDRELTEGQQEIARLRGEVQDRLDRMELEARERMQAAVAEANAERERVLNQTRQDAEQELARARSEIQRSKEEALSDLRSTVADLALAAAGRLLGETLDEDRDRRLVDTFIDQMPDADQRS